MSLMPYEPKTEGCAKCGRTMGKHPYIVPGLTREQVCEAFVDPGFVAGVDREEETTEPICNLASSCSLPAGHLPPCLSAYGETIEPTRSAVPVILRAQLCPHGNYAVSIQGQDGWMCGPDCKEPTRSAVHEVSTAGYADDIMATTFAQAHKTTWTCAKITGHQGACVTGGPVARRLEEIERVRHAFMTAWSRWWDGTAVDFGGVRFTGVFPDGTVECSRSGNPSLAYLK
jgi:hypothetical protein